MDGDEQMEVLASGPVVKKNPTNQFSANILKHVIGPERAQQAFNSISLGTIPQLGNKDNISLDCKHFCDSKQTNKSSFLLRLSQIKLSVACDF